MGREFSMPRRVNPKHKGQPDLAAEFAVVHPSIEQAARLASAALTELGVRHVLIGGVAVGAYAKPRTTKDVDFLVGPEAWPSRGLIVYPIHGLPVQVGDIAIDTLLAPHEAPTIEEALERGITSEGIPVAPPEVLVLMKLIADRAQDRHDIDTLLGVVDHETVREYVERHGPEYVEALAAAITEHERQREKQERGPTRRLTR
jgi:hypothetical protein